MTPARRNQNWLPSIFNDFFGEDWLPSHAKQQAAPAVNIIEREKSYRIEVAAPGMCKEDFTVQVENDNQLVIALEKKSTREAEPKQQDDKNEKREDGQPTYLRREFSYSSFRQSFILPDEVDSTKIDAKMPHGVLTLDRPKRESRRELPASRRIEIK